MLSACGAKASTFTLRTRKRGIIFSRPPSPRLSSPPHSSVPGALLLLRDQETALNVMPSSSDTKQGAMALLMPPILEGTRGVSIHALGSRSWLTAEARTSDSTPEWPRMFSAENHHGQHYWPVRYYVETHKGLFSPATCCSINQDESCGM